MTIAIVLGTRPEIIKMSPIIRELETNRKKFFILHTGQHYSPNLDEIFFTQLQLTRPKYNLEVGSGSHAEETGKMLVGIEKILLTEKPYAVLVQGDTNSVLAGALAATKLHIKVGHIEAGLRSYDKNMPEEVNRILTDHCSDYLFAPTEKAKAILLSEGIPGEKIFITGNTIVDAIHQNLKIARQQGDVLQSFHLDPKQYFLVTLHRQENVDSQERFASILRGLDKIAGEFHLPLIYPIHPRARKMIKAFHFEVNNIELTDPLDYQGFLQLEANARLILTDSGGIQEEGCVLGVPCVTLRDNTERPETLEVGANILAGTDSDRILQCSKIMLDKHSKWLNPFGDGKAAERIINIVNGGL